ncbi:MAG: DNA adenine methylase [Treponema sp.]|jgi:DNA adenine methylase|nr:DNA adenine methylase [Treponema sp.]
MARYKSPLRYPGGKAALAPVISSIIVDNGYSDTYYAEPFAGGAGAALDLLFSERVWKILLNDADFHLFAFWKSIIDKTEQFCERIKTVPLTIAQWKKQKNIFDAVHAYTLYEVGFATFYLNRTNHSGILDGMPIGGLEQTGKWKINARFNRSELIDRIKRIASYKGRIEIFNLEARLFLAHLNSLTKTVFVYLDPPYYQQGPELYLNFYSTEDHKSLALYIQNELRHPWILTYDNVKEIENLYQKQNSITFDLSYSAGAHKKGRERLFFSSRLTSVPKAITP